MSAAASVAPLSRASWRPDRRRLEALIVQADHWRRSPRSAGGGGAHKEWSHFCVLGPEVDVLLNFSLMDAVVPGGGPEVPRLTLLVRDPEGRWHGDVEAGDPGALELAAGGIDLRFGPHALRFESGVYVVEAQLPERGVAVQLRLQPVARPALTSSIPLGDAATMKWFVVPRLEAWGEVEIGRRRFALRRAPAYHDHDWGRFRWGGDFSWEWAIALPADPEGGWSLVFQRISDRARLRALSQGILLWRHGSHFRTLHGRDVQVESEGRLPTTGALRVPRIMSLLAPGAAADLPRRITARGHSGSDRLDLELELLDLAQVAIPSDVPGRRATIVSEARAIARAQGRVRGEAVGLEAPAVVELNRAAC